MSMKSSADASSACARAPSATTDGESTCTRLFKLIPPRSGFYRRGERIPDSSLYLRIPLDFYRSHLRTCVRLLVEMYIDRAALAKFPDQFVCEEMRVLVSWLSSDNAFGMSSHRLTRFVKKVCVPLGLDWYADRCEELPDALMKSFYNCGLLSKKSDC